MAHGLMRLVEHVAEAAPQVRTRDRCDVILVAAYGRAYRCLRSIRETAARGEADDTAVLVRALLALTLRALYIVQPDEMGERQRRLAQWVHRSRRDQRAMINELKELSYDFTDADLKRAEELVEAQRWAGALPSDKDLATELDLAQLYSHVYRETSDATHYGIFTMLEGFAIQPTSVTGEDASVALDKIDAARPADALALGVVVFGTLLERTDAIIGHGVTSEALTLVRSHFGMTET